MMNSLIERGAIIVIRKGGLETNVPWLRLVWHRVKKLPLVHRPMANQERVKGTN